jgi:predicted RND superfamily exporter protein
LTREKREATTDENDQDLSEMLQSSVQTPLISSKKSSVSASEVEVIVPVTEKKDPHVARRLFKLSDTQKQKDKKGDILDMPSLSEALQVVERGSSEPSTVVSSPSSSKISSRSSSRSNSLSD